MSAQLLEIDPRELKFIFELKKQSSCSVRLTNNTYQNVAFKVKTTSPKKYCVRPNVGIVMPKSTCEFTVTMQAQKVVPPEMACKDKFLIQSTVVPFGTTEKDITSSMFSKADGKYPEEVKLRVVLISPPQSPVLSPINGAFKQGPPFDASLQKEPVLSRVEILTPQHVVNKDVEFKGINDNEFVMAKVGELKPKMDMNDGQEFKPPNDADFIANKDVVNGNDLKPGKDEELKPEMDAFNDKELNPAKDAFNEKELNLSKDAFNDKELDPARDAEVPQVNDAEFVKVKAVEELKLASDVEEMKSKLNSLESKLNEAESTISKLTEERRISTQERKILQEELVILRSRTSVKRAQPGFPLLFVVMVALISIVLGYRFRSSFGVC